MPRVLVQLLRTLFYGIAQHNGIGNFFHGFTPLLALALQNLVGLWLSDPQIPLQNCLGAFYELAGFQLLDNGPGASAIR